jgi:hypothetical protein
LETRATLSADRGHFDGTPVGIHRHHRDDTDVWKKNIIERAISVQQDLTRSAGNPFKLRQQPLEIAGWESEEETIARPVWRRNHPL